MTRTLDDYIADAFEAHGQLELARAKFLRTNDDADYADLLDRIGDTYRADVGLACAHRLAAGRDA